MNDIFIIVHKNNFALVDVEDRELVIKYSWTISNRGYVQASPHRWEKLLLHRYLLGISHKSYPRVDHRNRKPFDCRRHNLLKCSGSLNCHNRTKKSNTSSKYIGVHYHKKYKKWQASVFKDGRMYYAGRHNEEIEAAKAYNKKAQQVYGNLANINVI